MIYLSDATPCKKRMRIVAASARVAVPSGTMVVAVRPVISPSALAHSIASSAQLLMLAASVYALKSAPAFRSYPLYWAYR